MIAPPADCNTSQIDTIVLAIVAFIGLEKKNVDPVSVVLLPPFLLVLVLAKGNFVISIVLIFTSFTATFLFVNKWMQAVATVTLHDGYPKPCLIFVQGYLSVRTQQSLHYIFPYRKTWDHHFQATTRGITMFSHLLSEELWHHPVTSENKPCCG